MEVSDQLYDPAALRQGKRDDINKNLRELYCEVDITGSG
jgi:hypothetical protein